MEDLKLNDKVRTERLVLWLKANGISIRQAEKYLSKSKGFLRIREGKMSTNALTMLEQWAGDEPVEEDEFTMSVKIEDTPESIGEAVDEYWVGMKDKRVKKIMGYLKEHNKFIRAIREIYENEITDGNPDWVDYGMRMVRKDKVDEVLRRVK